MESIYWNFYCSQHTRSMQSIEDEESLSQRFTYQEKVTGLLILTVTCTYPRSAVSFIFLTPLGDTFASKELNPTSNVGNVYREKNNLPPNNVSRKQVFILQREFTSSAHQNGERCWLCFISCHQHQSSRAKVLTFTALYLKECLSISTFSGLQSI